MSSCDNCPSKGTCSSQGTSTCSIKVLPKYGNVKNVIGVISGKGGVGKSTVTGIMASMLRKKGYSVGVLDADITGPSMPRFFGINQKRGQIIPIDENTVKFIPVETMPPGTGDIALTVMQDFPIKELVIVSTPQDMVSMIVKKVVIMAEKIGIKIKGVVENMSYITCTDCDKKIRVFSKKSAEEHAEYLGLPLLGELPIDLDFTEALEEGKAEEYVIDSPLYSLIFEGLY